VEPPLRFNPNAPTFDIQLVQQLAQARSVRINAHISDKMAEVGLTNEDVFDALSSLDQQDFHKTMAWQTYRGQMLDVYYVNVRGSAVYLKFSILNDSIIHISSFKEDGQI
jgi:hypothetical protein